jgi:hypothetical protein
MKKILIAILLFAANNVEAQQKSSQEDKENYILGAGFAIGGTALFVEAYRTKQEQLSYSKENAEIKGSYKFNSSIKEFKNKEIALGFTAGVLTLCGSLKLLKTIHTKKERISAGVGPNNISIRIRF